MTAENSSGTAPGRSAPGKPAISGSVAALMPVAIIKHQQPAMRQDHAHQAAQVRIVEQAGIGALMVG
jgi:hypothetical protein